jgi:hypothetical protein
MATQAPPAHQHPPPPNASAPPPTDPETLRAWAGLRTSAILRLKLMNIFHSGAAWRMRRGNPLCPYAFGFLYAYPAFGSTPEQQIFEVGAATRVIKAGEEVSHLPRVLYDLTQTARYYLGRGGLDPRQPPQMCQRVDEQVKPDSTFIGVGISSLDGPLGTWEQTMRRVESEDRIPGRYYIQLIDPEATRIRVDRSADPWETPVIETTAALHDQWRMMQSRPEEEPIWTGLAQLVDLVQQGAQQIAQARNSSTS